MSKSSARLNLPQDEMLQRSKDSAAMVDYWNLNDTVLEGVDAVRAQRETYLPRFVEEENEEYNFRLKCTKMTNTYRDIVENLASKPFEQKIALSKDKEKTIPPSIAEFVDDVDGSGNILTVFAAQTFFNGITSALDWIFVDYSKPDPNIRTLADERAAGMRPYWSHVLARNVIDVKSQIIGGNEILTYMKIYEPGEPNYLREFIRTDDGEVIWNLYEYRENAKIEGKNTKFVLVESGTISIGVIPLVPFITGRRDGRSWRFYPTMRDALDLQIELYQQESGLKFARVLTAYPMLAANGLTPPMDAQKKPIKIRVGPNRVLYAPPDGNGRSGNWAYVEPSALSLQFLSADIKETRQELRELGRQPLTVNSGNLTVITTAVAASKAKTVVGAWSLQLKDTLENALILTAMWLGISKEQYDPDVAVSIDFEQFSEDKDVDALITLREKRQLSKTTLWEELKRRRVLSDQFDPNREEQRLLEETPSDGEDLIREGTEDA